MKHTNAQQRLRAAQVASRIYHFADCLNPKGPTARGFGLGWVQSGASATRTLCLRTVREIPTYERLAIDELTYPHVGDSNWCEIACEMRRL